ncbi:endolytic transglycosylase MltG [Nesterenkonia sphaerica]|uniref:Endolytic murein transglycosylase n=1 Tax=Nesterenkonia sphaerica TaxID=1804988 RepID=A0A5R9ALB5_9MICC|nr:endolytic transglycosylase MltG [Nesterenkonia sphaerica]TLP79393.1 hypothetical protein FEF27_01990 [Nesterenkonia sphaerica]
MSDEQSPEVGSRRRRREIRESRERERAAQRERESAVRRLSSSSTASGAAEESTGRGPNLFDQETTTPKDERRSTPASTGRTTAAGASAKPEPGSPSPGFRSRRERRQQTQEHPAVPPVSQAQRTQAPEKPSRQQPATGAAAVPPSAAPALDTQTPSRTDGAPEPEQIPMTGSPSTPFEEVVAPPSARSPEYDQLPPEYDYDEHEELDWDEAYDEDHLDHDEHGTPILVSASGYGRGYQTVAPVEGRVNHALLRKRRAKRRRRNITLTVALLGFATLMVAFVMIVQSLLGGDEIADYETVAGDEVEFQIYPNEGLASIQNRLVDEEIIAGPEAFQEALEDLDPEANYHAETLTMREQMPAAEAVEVIFGDGQQVGYININAGFRLDDTLDAIAEGAQIPREDLRELNEDPQQFGLPDQAEDLEGFLAAGEYEPPVDASAEDIIQMIVDPTLERLEDLGVTDPDEQWETIIIASLITAEANNTISDERPREERLEDYRIMAGAIENRLEPDQTETDGLLQIDAAVNYGIGLSGDLHFPEEERLNAENEYNTYVHPGLPPGPIGVPVADTVTAAADPAETGAFYWVTVNPITGETRFNETYAAHQEDTEEFLEFCRENEGACGPGDVDAAEDEFDG